MGWTETSKLFEKLRKMKEFKSCKHPFYPSHLRGYYLALIIKVRFEFIYNFTFLGLECLLIPWIDAMEQSSSTPLAKPTSFDHARLGYNHYFIFRWQLNIVLIKSRLNLRLWYFYILPLNSYLSIWIFWKANHLRGWFRIKY